MKMNHSFITATLACLCVFGMTIASQATLIHHWELNETTGTVAVDSVIGGGDGSYRNSPALGQPAPYPALGTSVAFAGGATGQDIQLPDATVGLGSLTQDFTIVAWVRFDALTATNPIVTGNLGTSNWSFMVLSNGAMRLQTFDGSNTLVGASFNTTTLATDTWYQVAVSLASDNSVRFYIDGDLDRATTIGGVGTATTDPFYIAGRGQAFPGASIDGNIADVRVYNTVLSDSEVQTLFDNVIPEPGSLSLLCMGGLLLLRYRR